MIIPDEAVQAAQATYMTFGIDDEMMREALTAALPFLQGVKVKALTWREDKLRDGRKKWLSSEEVITETHPSWEHQGFHLFHAAKTFDTVDEAKAAAQADYSARILSAIEPAPSPRAQALEEVRVIAEKQKAYWFEKQKSLRGLEDTYSEDGEVYTPLGDHEAWKSGSANGHYSEADWFLQTIEGLSSQPVADGWLPIETEERAKALAVSLRQCSIFVAADVGKHIAKSMTDAADFLEALPSSPGAPATRPTGGSDADA